MIDHSEASAKRKLLLEQRLQSAKNQLNFVHGLVGWLSVSTGCGRHVLVDRFNAKLFPVFGVLSSGPLLISIFS